ncbi:MAG: hypothetical protein QM722_02405 [Piscinibacter sp.]
MSLPLDSVTMSVAGQHGAQDRLVVDQRERLGGPPDIDRGDVEAGDLDHVVHRSGSALLAEPAVEVAV